MKNNSYFPHDSDAKDDPKIILLIDSLNPEGYGIFWILVETLRAQENFKLPLIIIPSIARKFNTSAEKVKAVVMNFGLFEVENEQFFYSKSLINRMGEIAEKKLRQSEGGKKGMLKRWQENKSQISIDSQENDKLLISNLSEKNNLLITSKVKESKVNNKYIYSDFYDSEIEKADKDDKLFNDYVALIRFMFGANEMKTPLKNILSIKKQITFDNFINLMEVRGENKIGQTLLKIENDQKYYKGKQSLYLTLKNWLTNKFVK